MALAQSARTPRFPRHLPTSQWVATSYMPSLSGTFESCIQSGVLLSHVLACSTASTTNQTAKGHLQWYPPKEDVPMAPAPDTNVQRDLAQGYATGASEF